jgi:carbamoyl-phosphate synthase large subunit
VRGAFGVPSDLDESELRRRLLVPSAERVYFVMHALETGYSSEELHELTRIDPWFLDNLREIIEHENELRKETLETLSRERLRAAKRMGFRISGSPRCSAQLEGKVRRARKEMGVAPVFKRVDTCGAEFESFTPYLYSTYEDEDEADTSDRKKVIILGSTESDRTRNRVRLLLLPRLVCLNEGFESIMVNCNPETVSTDYDTSDRLYFEPVTFEDVMEIVERERPYGVIVQFGGQTPLNLAMRLLEAGVPIIGTSPESIDLAEDRKRFGNLLSGLAYQPPNGTRPRMRKLATPRPRSATRACSPQLCFGGRNADRLR